jgi:predicted GIY-YIG superfamily endonuclease
MFWLYMLRCADDSFYVGHTDNLESRIAQHQQGAFPDCYTFTRRPVRLVYSQDFATRDEAFVMERRIKGWSRAKKVALIGRDWREISRISRFKFRDVPGKS